MNVYTEIIIAGVTVAAFEGDEDLMFKFSYRVADSIGNTRGSSADRFIKLPATKETNALYGSFEDINVKDKAAYSAKPTTITENGVTVFEGLSFLQRLTLSGKGRPYSRTGEYYEILLVGTNANWRTAIKGLRLADLPLETLPFDAPTIQASEEFSYDSGNQSAWGLIKWKSWNNETLTSINHSVKVEYSEFTPLLFNRTLIDLIFDSIGYNIQGDLLNSQTLKSTVFAVPPVEKYPPEYSEQFLNVSASSGTVFLASNPQYTPLIGLTTDSIAPSPKFSWNPANAEYIVQEDGFIKVKMSLEILNVGPVDNGSVVVLGITINSSSVFSEGIVQIGSATGTAPINGTQAYGEKVYKVFAGDIVTLRSFYGVSFGITDVDVQYNISIEGESLYKIGTPINFNYLLSDYQATDYLTFLEDQFNARFDVDEAKRIVYINSRNGFVDVPPTAIGGGSYRGGFYNDSINNDYTSKLDYQKDAKLKSFNSKRNFVYSYESDGETEKAVEQGAVLGIGSASYDTETNQEGTEEKESRFFTKTPCILDRLIQLSPTNPISNPSNKIPLVPLIFNGDYTENEIVNKANYDIKPRILHFIGNRGTNATKINIDDPTQNDVLTIGDLFFTNYNDRYGADPSLSYANETINGNLVTGLLDRFFLHELATIRNNKRLDEWIVWDSLMVNNLSFRETILLHGTRFINEEIQDYTPSQRQSIKTMLVPFILATDEDQANIQNTLLSGIINKI